LKSRENERINDKYHDKCIKTALNMLKEGNKGLIKARQSGNIYKHPRERQVAREKVKSFSEISVDTGILKWYYVQVAVTTATQEP